MSSAAWSRRRFLTATSQSLHRLQHGPIAGVNVAHIARPPSKRIPPWPELPKSQEAVPRAGNETRTRLLAAGTIVLPKRGYHAARVDDIVEQAGVPLEAVEHFVYGSTYVTNLFIEQKESGVGLITTAGFRDVLEIGRASRKPDVYDIHWRPARPFVARHLRFGVPERVDHLGQVITPLDEEAARQALRALAAAGVQSIAVCLLHAYANPRHERRIAELAEELQRLGAESIALQEQVATNLEEVLEGLS